MILLGKTQTLCLSRLTEHGAYLTADKETPLTAASDKEALTVSELLLPKQQLTGQAVGDSVSVFVYKDSEDRPIATTQTPYVELGGIARLTVTQVTRIGAFLDWGLAKDLFLPFREQTVSVKEGDEIPVTVYIDKSSRLCASMRLYHALSTASPYQKDDRVTGYVYETSANFGAFVAVDDRYSALIPVNELYHPLSPGQTVEARVAKVLPDGKLTLSLREKAHVQISGDSRLIYSALRSADGFLPFHDKSDPEAVKARFGLSKNAFKRAIGHLYKENLITISEDGIRLTNKEEG